MDFINNRYKLIKILKENQGGYSFLSSDTWNENKLIQLNIISNDLISTSLINYFSNEFLGITGLNCNEIIKNISFDIVASDDKNTSLEKSYMYTTEYIENPIGLLEYIKDKDIFEIMDVFINICKTVHYLHLKGYVYGAINLNNVLILQDGKDYRLKMKDLPTIKLEQEILMKNDKENECFQLPSIVDIKLLSRKHDMYSLGVLFLSMLKKDICNSNLKMEMQYLKKSLNSNKETNFNKDEIDFILKVLPIIEKLVKLNREFPYDYIYEFINEINNRTNNKYSVVDKKDLERLNFNTKLINRKDDIETIKKAYNNIIRYEPSKKVYLIEGDLGVGKTRFLKEIKFLLKLQGAKIYSSFNLNDLGDDNEMWREILRRIFLESDKKTIEKYKLEFEDVFSNIMNLENEDFINYIEKSNNKYQLLNRIAKLIVNSIKKQPSIIIIDNIHLASKLSLDILKYIYSEIMSYENIILILSYEEEPVYNNKIINQFTLNFKNRIDSEIIHLKNLNLEESGEMIKEILSVNYVPKAISERLHSKTHGNPLFITEIIKSLYIDKIIFIDEDSGFWYDELPKDDLKYKGLSIPNNMSQVFSNQFKDINNIERQIINIISVYYNPISLNELSDLLDINNKDIVFYAEKLIKRGLLFKYIEENDYIYEINNKIFRDIIYEEIPSGKRVEQHKKLSKILENKLGNEKDINLEQLIYHLEKSHNKEKLKTYLMKDAKEKLSSKDFKASIDNYKRILSYLEEDDNIKKI